MSLKSKCAMYSVLAVIMFAAFAACVVFSERRLAAGFMFLMVACLLQLFVSLGHLGVQRRAKIRAEELGTTVEFS